MQIGLHPNTIITHWLTLGHDVGEGLKAGSKTSFDIVTVIASVSVS
jgi:hypothetical protein